MAFISSKDSVVLGDAKVFSSRKLKKKKKRRKEKEKKKVSHVRLLDFLWLKTNKSNVELQWDKIC